MSSAVTTVDSGKVFVSDCEGPISKNDNAFELASHSIPDGNRLFTLISRYDDVLADVVKREGYKAGDTLKLILPFLKAYDVTNRSINEYSARNILLVPGSKEMLKFVRGFLPSFIVSTSYEHYMRALCSVVDFPFENVYCTRLDLDKYSMSDQEKKKLKTLRARMVKMPIPNIPPRAKSLKDFPTNMQQTVQRLDEIFWRDINCMDVGRIFKDINPVGGFEKAAAVNDIASRKKTSFGNVMYVGDSITDVEAFKLVRRGGGLTVSFNGNSFAVREAEVAVLSKNAVVTAVLADVFSRFGKAQVMNLIEGWKPSMVGKFRLYQPLKTCFLRLCRGKLPRVEIVNERNMERLMRESSSYRKSVRGKAVGRLG